MSIKLRGNLDRPLSIDEIDNNFRELNAEIVAVVTPSSVSDLTGLVTDADFATFKNDVLDIFKGYYNKDEVKDLVAVGNGSYGTQSGETNAINSISVNGVAVEIIDKNVDIIIPQTDLSGYSTTEQMNTAINSAIAGLSHISRSIVSELPQIGDDKIIYMLPNGENGENSYTEYMWIDNKFEVIGSTDIDLSGYVKLSEVNTLIDDKISNLNISSGASLADLLVTPNIFVSNLLIDNDIFATELTATGFVENNLLGFISKSGLFELHPNAIIGHLPDSKCVFKAPQIVVNSTISEIEVPSNYNAENSYKDYFSYPQYYKKADIEWEIIYPDNSKHNGNCVAYIKQLKTDFIEYAIASDGAFIDTGLTLDYSYIFKATGSVSKESGVLMGAYASNENRTLGKILPNSNKFQTQWAKNVEILGENKVIFSQKFSYMQKANTLEISQNNNALRLVDSGHITSGSDTNVPICLFKETPNANQPGIVTIYEASILQSDGKTILKHFKPIRLGDSVNNGIIMLDVANLHNDYLYNMFEKIDIAVENGVSASELKEYLINNTPMSSNLTDRIYAPSVGKLTPPLMVAVA